MKKTAEILNIDISGIKLDNDMSFKKFFYRNINVLHHILVDNKFWKEGVFLLTKIIKDYYLAEDQKKLFFKKKQKIMTS